MYIDINTFEFVRRTYFRVQKYFSASLIRPSVHNEENYLISSAMHDAMNDMRVYLIDNMNALEIICECGNGYLKLPPVFTANSDIQPWYEVTCTACDKAYDLENFKIEKHI